MDSLIPGLEAPQAQRHSGQPELIPAGMSGQHPGPQRRKPSCNFWLQFHSGIVITERFVKAAQPPVLTSATGTVVLV